MFKIANILLSTIAVRYPSSNPSKVYSTNFMPQTFLLTRLLTHASACYCCWCSLTVNPTTPTNSILLFIVIISIVFFFQISSNANVYLVSNCEIQIRNMHNGQSNNNESFKLLQLSDDSKSLSDLEVPIIVNQRKRKVRR